MATRLVYHSEYTADHRLVNDIKANMYYNNKDNQYY